MAEPQRVEITFVSPLRVIQEPAPVGQQFVTIAYEGFTVKIEGDKVMYTLPADHTVRMQVSYVDAAGNPATIDGEVAWSSSDEAILTVQGDDADSTICTVVAVGPVGNGQIVATCDADLGSGVRELITTADISVIAGEAFAGSIQPVGEPEPATD
jgi:hypothetical protein